jgi:hypothetical protein
MWTTAAGGYAMVAATNTMLIIIGKDVNFVSTDGYLMPVRKGQVSPDRRYLKTAPQRQSSSTKSHWH